MSTFSHTVAWTRKSYLLIFQILRPSSVHTVPPGKQTQPCKLRDQGKDLGFPLSIAPALLRNIPWRGVAFKGKAFFMSWTATVNLLSSTPKIWVILKTQLHSLYHPSTRSSSLLRNPWPSLSWSCQFPHQYFICLFCSFLSWWQLLFKLFCKVSLHLQCRLSAAPQ